MRENSRSGSVKAADIEQYDSGFFLDHTARQGYATLAHLLFRLFKPTSAVDFGCGIGETLFHLRRRGVVVFGIDGSPASAEFARIPMNIVDLTKRITLESKFDLAISTEVGEHLPESAADAFVGSIAGHGVDVFFTAAQPGQGGRGHINCQPKGYWEEKFAAQGMERARIAEASIRLGMLPMRWGGIPWISRNLQVFTRSPGRLNARGLWLGMFFAAESVYWRARASRLGGGVYWVPGGETSPLGR
ncbi:class I SAM-dependent methyltransferase [Thiohalocapsa halophila]|uniref:class I SAM-dependent methyltransferase n=1 Tax=Thiohalocapsa halophila TaxID=69359 RepID=UPI0019059136|nr:class I SAM-dependent methyltransferase [Thiohalocapsa halophila]